MTEIHSPLTYCMNSFLRLLGHFSAFCFLILFTHSQATASSHSNGNFADYKIKSVYVYRFASFVRWSKKTQPTIRFCTLGRNRITVTLQQLITSKNQPDSATSIRSLNSLGEANGNCEILYITENKLRELQSIPQFTGVLTVSDNKHFLRSGGMVELRSIGNRIKPAIALDNVKKGQLTISSQLLRIALLPSEDTGGDNE